MITKKKIRIGIIGVGNCASSLVQGISFYKQHPCDEIGLTKRRLAGYDISDIDVVTAFDIDQRKVGKRLSEAIFAAPNVATKFETHIVDGDIIVQPSPALDGVSKEMLKHPEERRFLPVEKSKKIDKHFIVEVLRRAKPDFLICYLPVGSKRAVKFYAECALRANISFINAMPEFIASNQRWIKRFREKKLLVLGDDIKSQLGATIIHRVIADMFMKRGVALEKTYQINIGGNTDFLNMKDPTRLDSKLKSKTGSVRSQCNNSSARIYAGPADYVEYLHDNKIAYFNLVGRGFGRLPINIDIKLSVEDSPNSAGVMVDVLRMAKAELEAGAAGSLDELSAYAFKSPLVQYPDRHLFQWKDEWIKRRHIER